MAIPKINLAALETVFDHLEMKGVGYGLGAKAPSLDCDTHDIDRIDCSGFTRYAIAKATGQALIIPDGSQNQRDWCEQRAAAGELHQLARYPDVVNVTPRRLFIAFIRPGYNNAGDIGHVWFVSQLDGESYAATLESHGGRGVSSRPWNTRVLKREAYSAFELPVV